MNKIEKIICKVKAKNYCVVHFKYLQQAISDRPQLTKAHKVIKLKQVIIYNTALRTNVKNIFKKIFYKIINTVYAKTMANMGIYKNIKFVRNDRKRNNLA